MQAINFQVNCTDQENFFNDPLNQILYQFENQLNPAKPEKGLMPSKVLAYGEVSSVISIADLPGQVCKRMSGFTTAKQVQSYIELVKYYCHNLKSLGVGVVPTRLVSLSSPLGGFVVYLVQPHLPIEELGNSIVRDGTDDQLLFVVSEFLKNTENIFSFNNNNPENLLIAADSQISNWHVTRQGIRLLDVGTPCLRRGKKDFFDSTIIGNAMPLPMRFVFNKAGLMQRYFDAYFSSREIIVDHVANYIKEGRPDRIPEVLKYIHQWIDKHGCHLKIKKEITVKEIKSFYLKDVILLETFLQCRRLDRFIKTRVMKKSYNYILPGKISRMKKAENILT